MRLKPLELADGGSCGAEWSLAGDKRGYENGRFKQRVRGMNRASLMGLTRAFMDAGIEFTGGDTPGTPPCLLCSIRHPRVHDYSPRSSGGARRLRLSMGITVIPLKQGTSTIDQHPVRADAFGN